MGPDVLEKSKMCKNVKCDLISNNHYRAERSSLPLIYIKIMKISSLFSFTMSDNVCQNKKMCIDNTSLVVYNNISSISVCAIFTYKYKQMHVCALYIHGFKN